MSSKNAAKVHHIAPKRQVAQAPIIEFSVGFVRDDVEEPHEFSARLRLSYGDIAGIVKNQSSVDALPFFDRMIRRALVNTDGTPLNWAPEVADGQFEGPDGVTYPVEELPKFTAFEAGSSRRRWVHLMDRDEEVELEIDQVMEIMKLLTTKEADRPT